MSSPSSATPSSAASSESADAVLRGAAAFVALLALALALYAPCIDGAFVSDDVRFIAQNGANLDQLTAPWRFFSDPGTNANPPDGDIYRPLRTLSFALDRALFGMTPRAFHLHSIVLHALVSWLLLHWLRGFVPRTAAWLGTLVFLAHPLGSEAVAWIASRSDLQAATFALLALLAARRAEGGPFAFGCSGLAFAAGLAKETAVVVPVLYLVDRGLRSRTLRPPRGTWFAPTFALMLGTAAYLALYLAVRDRGIAGQVDWYGGSLATHLPFSLLGIARHLTMLVVPTRFNFIHEPALYAGHDRGDLVLALAVVSLPILAAVLAQRKFPGVTFGFAFYAIALLPAANLVLPLRSVLAERFAYLPLAGIALAVASLAARLRSPLATALVAVAVLAPCAVLTQRRAADFESPLALYRATAESWPDSYSAALGFGDEALSAGRFDEARLSFARAIALAERIGDVRAAQKARLAAGRCELLARDFAAAATILRGTIEVFETDPTLAAALPAIDAQARHALGTALALSLRLDEAAIVYDELIARHGETAERLDARSEVERARAGDGNLVLELLHRAITLDPDYAPARIHRAEVYRRLDGFYPEAVRELREVLARDPTNTRARALLEEFIRDPPRR